MKGSSYHAEAGGAVLDQVLQSVVEHIRGAERILVASHIDPDGDSIGAILGLAHALRRLGKQSVPASPSTVPSKYGFLIGVETIVREPQGKFDLYVSLDCSDAERLDSIYGMILRHPDVPLVNIDHHVTNIRFGTVNWVDSEAAAASEMVVSLIDALGVGIDREIALPLLTGIVTDTRGFRTASTSAAVLRTASRLIDAGVLLSEVTERTLNVRPYSTLCLWGAMLRASHLDGRIAWAVLTPAIRAACGYREDDQEADEGFVNFLASAREADVGIVFREKGDGSIEVGFRSKPGISIAEVALSLGGGGHPQAAGCTLYGTLDDVRETVLNAVRVAIADQRALFT